jgi:hypothetical protein
MMQVNVENIFNNVFRTTIFRELCDVEGPLVNIILFTKLFYGAYSFLYYEHGRHVEGVTFIESFLGMRQGDPLGGLLFIFAHYRTFIEIIARTTNYVFPSPTILTSWGL